jgi:hypothetical protein
MRRQRQKPATRAILVLATVLGSLWGGFGPAWLPPRCSEPEANHRPIPDHALHLAHTDA